MFNRIKKIFLESNILIKSENKLDDYILFCIDKNVGHKIKNKTECHHILPKTDSLPFGIYSDLHTNNWNGTHLIYEDHIKAHVKLNNAVEHWSITYTVYKYLVKGDLTLTVEEALILKNENALKMSKVISQAKNTDYYKKYIEPKRAMKYKKTIREIEENGLTKLENKTIKACKTKQSKEWKETVGKEAIKKKVENTDYARSGKKCSETKQSKEWKETIGKEATRKRLEKTDYTKNGKKSKETKEKIFIKNGEITSIYKENGKKCSKTKQSKEWKETVGAGIIKKLEENSRIKHGTYTIYKDSEIIESNLLRKEINKISQAFIKTSPKKLLGDTKRSRTLLTKNNKEKYIGCYAILVKRQKD